MEILKEILKNSNITLTEQQINQLMQFKEMLLDWNEKINLTTIVDEKEIYVKHFLDSLLVEKYIPINSKLLDLGTGAGFPGIPLKIAREDLNITLVDSVNKKLIYLNEVINKLDLKNINTLHGRFEELGQDIKYREMYDVLVSRAVANMSTLAEYSLPFVRIGGTIICMKGPNVQEEVENAKVAIIKLGGEIQKVVPYYLKEIDAEYNLVIIKKVAQTDKCYPRKPGKPSKEPIK